jgi:hypothetical protein
MLRKAVAEDEASSQIRAREESPVISAGREAEVRVRSRERWAAEAQREVGLAEGKRGEA